VSSPANHEACQHFTEYLAATTDLHTLSINNSAEIDDAGVLLLNAALKANTSIRTLKLIELAGAPLLHYVTAARDSSATALHLVGCELENACWQPIEAVLAMDRLDELLIQLCGVNDQHASHLAAALARNTSLVTVRLACNAIGSAGIEAILTAVAHHPCLTTLQIGANNYGTGGLKHVSNYLTVNTTLQHLVLGDLAMDAEGAAMLAEGLMRNSTLLELTVSFNAIGDAGALALARVWTEAGTSGLTSLDLSYCSVRTAGLKALAEAWAHSHCLQRIDFDNNVHPHANSEDEAILVHLLRRNPFIRHIQPWYEEPDGTLIQSTTVERMCCDNVQRINAAVQLLISAQTLHCSSWGLLEDVTPALVYWLQSHTDIDGAYLLTVDQAALIWACAKQRHRYLGPAVNRFTLKDEFLRTVLRPQNK
jgi:hypothetical protein